ncbi:MAG TPA: MarR family winged helix-turn-helix transcriptional regulator [Solirubrobacteraceae bacterium]|nr:MarR family winged helix-turn-helix transcriptional regulator [Solirubrobacteraceae bacterium]
MVNTDRPPGSLALLSRLAKMVYRRTSEERLGMTLRHFVTLSYLRDRPTAPQQDLGDALCIDASNLVLLLNEVESAGLAERRRDPTDRRRHLVRLTGAGETALRLAEQKQEAIEAEIFHTLSTGERATLRGLLARALADAEPDSGTPGAGPAASTGPSDERLAASAASGVNVAAAG